MGIKSVGLLRNQTRFQVIPGQVGLNPGQVDRVGWGGAGWAGAGPSRVAN
jgi:hypothetical protein